MTVFLAALLIAATPSDRAPASPGAKPVCLKTETSPVVDNGAPTVHLLNREPDAQQGLAVVRTFGGCPVPVAVARDVIAK